MISQQTIQSLSPYSRMAAPILALNGVKIKEAAYVPSDAEKRNSQFSKPIDYDIPLLDIALFPNPAADYLTLDIEYNGKVGFEALEFRIKDTKEADLISGFVQLGLRQQMIDISKLIGGSYTLSILGNGEVMAHEIFTVIK